MLFPFIPKDPDHTNMTCRDGEIDFVKLMGNGHSDPQDVGLTAHSTATVSLTPTGEPPTATIRIPLQSGDSPKAQLLLSGEISRVDPATAERLTQAIVQKAAETLLDISTDLRRQGLFMLPFRVYSMTVAEDGTSSCPSPQAVALPADFPPHPEITAASVTDDCLTLTIRFPVRPHRLTVSPPENLPAGRRIRTFISYPLYIPDPKEMRGSIGSVRSASGGNTTGIRFGFLSISAIKASVAAPEKYYETVGNDRTGWRISSKAAAPPDYACYAGILGRVPPFPRRKLLALGEGVNADTDPLDWIADWVKAGPSSETTEGYLPVSLPYKYWNDDSSDQGNEGWPEGIDKEWVSDVAESLSLPYVLLTRPMTFATHEQSRRHANPTAIRTIRILGLPTESNAHALLYGSDDCVRWEALRRFDPRVPTSVLTPPRLFWRLLLWSAGFRACALIITT